jgi:hypothetical protein
MGKSFVREIKGDARQVWSYHARHTIDQCNPVEAASPYPAVKGSSPIAAALAGSIR